MTLTPNQIRKTICGHPRLMTTLPPHFTVIELPIAAGKPSWEVWEADHVKNLIRLALAKLSTRIFVQVINQGNTVQVAFEDPADASFFALLAAGHDFSQPC